jgi:hypothetical protein
VLEDALDSSERSDDVDSVVVELPELSVMSLRRPPERVRLEELVLLPVRSVLIRGIPRSHESSRSSSVSLRFWAAASFRFIEYSDQTRAESRNSASHG